MRMEPLSKRDFGAEDNPNFNLPAAIETFNWYMKSDRDEANLLLGMSISKSVKNAIDDDYEDMQAALDRQFAERMELLEKSVTNGAISKSMSDDAVNAAAEVVEFYKSTYSTYERAANADRQRRGSGGRFAPMGRTQMNYSHTQVRTPGFPGEKHAANIPNRHAAGQYQAAYAEVADALQRFGNGDTDVNGQVTAVDRNGNTIVRNVSGSKAHHFLNPADFQGSSTERGNVKSVDWYDAPVLTGAGTYADPLSQGGLALSQYNSGNVEAGRVNPLESGTTRGMRRVGNAADVVNNSGLADNASPKVKAALAAGKYVGDYGPEAEQVLGPHVRRSAYRYRGVERAPDKQMIGAMAASTRGSINPDEARRDLMVPKNTKVETGYGLEDRLQPSPFLQYWQSKLPDPELVDLHVNSGAIAPSEGVIINRKGEVVTQAVGYGDDHYLPFNLTKLSRAKGGEYIRTRTVGGPTTEDVYAGLMSGARSMTVVSHSGIYTVEFDESFRGGRRYNDKAARMMQRYGMLTDSLASEKVQLQQIPPARRKELRDRAAEEIPGNTPSISKERDRRYRELQELERKNPVPSKEKKEEWTQDFLLDTTDKMSSSDEQWDMTPERLRGQMEMKNGKRFESDEEFISALGEDEKYKKYMEFKQEEYRQSMKPLNLNGAGYHKALQALQEQFPYYISDVRYVPNQDVEGQKRRDKGYVKAKHLRSDDILTGYFDQEIEGAEPGYDKRGERLKGGKRRASGENYANWAAHQRTSQLRGYDDDGGGGSFSGGGTGSVGVASLGEEESTTPGTASNRSSMTHAGIQVRRGPGGMQYDGWSTSDTIARGRQQSDWEQINGLIKVREGLRDVDEITYYDNNTKKKAAVWSDDPENVIRAKYAVLASDSSDEEWVRSLQDDPDVLNEAVAELKLLRDAQGRRSIDGALYRSLEAKGKLVTGAMGMQEKPNHPKSVRGVVEGLKNGDERYYDFTTRKRNGEYYMPGLTEREYFAAWNSDDDIQSFMATSERRFGYRMSMTQDPHKFHGLSKDFGKAMDQGLNQADQWNKQIRQYGGVRNLPTHTVVKYGDNSYSAYSVSDLEDAIAKDAIAVAKMKQLYAVNVGAMPDPDDPNSSNEKVIEVDSEYEDKIPDLRFPKHDLEVKDQPVSFSTKETGKPKTERKAINEKKLIEARDEIDQMVGLGGAKREYNALVQDAQIAQLREAEGLPVDNKTMHLVFTGQPGTGKTTYAKSLAKTYNALGILPTDKVAVVTRSDLTGQYLGETAQKTRKVFDDNKGGVIFIDEAYSLNNGPDDQYGKEAIDEIVALSEERRGDTVVILAGYPGDVNSLFETNPGLKSRFPRTVKFPNYNPEQLNDIAHRQANNMSYEIEPNSATSKEISRVTRRIHMAPNMSNARDTRNFIDDVSRAHTSRISRIPEDQIDRKALTMVTPEDVKAAEKAYFSVRTGSVEKADLRRAIALKQALQPMTKPKNKKLLKLIRDSEKLVQV